MINEFKDIVDIVSQYDWKEAVSVGLGATVGFANAIYDKYKKNENREHNLVLVSTAAVAATVSATWGGGLERNTGNAVLSGVVYNIAYQTTYNFLDKMTKRMFG